MRGARAGGAGAAVAGRRVPGAVAIPGVRGILGPMPTLDPRVDAYIAASADFARPILEQLRAAVHAAAPDVEETIKWGFPCFSHRGLLCSMASHTAHCSFGYWKGALVLGEGHGEPAAGGMGSYGRLTSLADLPPDDVLAAHLREAVRLNEAGVKAPPRRKAAGAGRASAEAPDDLAAALAANDAARATFEGFSPSRRREYVEWVTEARTAATRARRVATAAEWLAEGKARNWKYERR